MTKPEASMDFNFFVSYICCLNSSILQILCMDSPSSAMKRALIESYLVKIIFKSVNGQRSMEANIETDNGVAKSIDGTCRKVEWQAG